MRRVLWRSVLPVLGAGGVVSCAGDGFVLPREDRYDFGEALVGFSKAMEIEVRVLDGEVTLEDAIDSGADADRFSAVFIPPIELKARDRFGLPGRFAPVEQRVHRAMLEVRVSRGTPIGFPVELVGEGVTAVQSGDVELVDGPVADRGETYRFGAVPIGTFRDLEVKVTNTSATELTATIGAAGGPFEVQGGPVIRIAPGATVTRMMRFTPTEEGQEIGAVVIDAGGRGLAGGTLTGTGVRRD